MTDFPLYSADDRVGYIPSPSQSGRFLHRNDWYLNSLSMASKEEFTPSNSITDVLIIGDSLVWGGNGYRWKDRLAEKIKATTQAQIWSVSAGSWSIVNELNYLEDHPEVVDGVDKIVFIVNEGDFGAPSSWQSEFSHPRERPISALLYLSRKYLLKLESPPTPEDLLVAIEDPMLKLNDFLASCECNVDFWVYPSRLETDGKTTVLSTDEMIEKLLGVLPEKQIHRVIDVDGWTSEIYSDQIHPTVKGFEILAVAIAETL